MCFASQKQYNPVHALIVMHLCQHLYYGSKLFASGETYLCSRIHLHVKPPCARAKILKVMVPESSWIQPCLAIYLLLK